MYKYFKTPTTYIRDAAVFEFRIYCFHPTSIFSTLLYTCCGKLVTYLPCILMLLCLLKHHLVFTSLSLILLDHVMIFWEKGVPL